MLAETAVQWLVTDPHGTYVDATVGGGGHSWLIAKRLAGDGVLIGCDRDADAITHSQKVLPQGVVLVQGRFSELERLVAPYLRNGVQGVLMDLGISSYQIDTAERGFSHRMTGPLDLRMDPREGETAAGLLARLDLNELTRLLREYGEESQARRIAKAILHEQEREPIRTTDALARVIGKAVPATRVKSLARVFQALRIAVNDELAELEQGLAAAWRILAPGGRLVVVTYHSLEDRVTKHFMRAKTEVERDPIGLPRMVDIQPEGRLPVKKPIVPDSAEILQNPRSRSAKLRVLEKLT